MNEKGAILPFKHLLSADIRQKVKNSQTIYKQDHTSFFKT